MTEGHSKSGKLGSIFAVDNDLSDEAGRSMQPHQYELCHLLGWKVDLLRVLDVVRYRTIRFESPDVIGQLEFEKHPLGSSVHHNNILEPFVIPEPILVSSNQLVKEGYLHLAT